MSEVPGTSTDDTREPGGNPGRLPLRLTVIAGARPNFVKVAPLLAAFSRHGGIATRLVDTGQHYHPQLSGAFFSDLGLPPPDAALGVGSASHARQTARVMTRLETEVLHHSPDRLVVVGDVNSTLAAALVGAKMGIPVDHVEAGLRSGDRSMPEEINRLVTDSIASRFFASEPAAVRNLRAEGHDDSAIFHVGNVMIDSLAALAPKARRRAVHERLGLQRWHYGLVTLHRPSNVDEVDRLADILDALGVIARRIPLVFPVHPRTKSKLRSVTRPAGVRFLEPLGYLDFVSLQTASRFVITDSGGIQEETTWLRIPCLTLRDSTERPITVTRGTNTIVGREGRHLSTHVARILAGRYKQGSVPALWDGRASQRVAAIIAGASPEPHTRRRHPQNPRGGRSAGARSGTREARTPTRRRA